MTALPLEGMRVIDFGLILAMPHATQWLATLGAEVIKVESKVHPDIVRAGGTIGGSADNIPGPNRAGLFNSLNYAKKSCSLNLATEEGRQLARRLAALGDVVVENFTTPVAHRFGLTYEALREVKPDVILVSCSALGRTGPLRDAVGWGPASQAYGGIPTVTGYMGDSVPQAMGGTWPDYLVGAVSVFPIMAAILHRDLTGEGQFVDLAMAEVVTTMMPQAIIDYQMNGRTRGLQGNRDPLMVPHNVYRCAGEDAWVAVSVGSEEEWAALAGAVDRPGWRHDPRFADAYARRKHEDQLDGLLTEWTCQRTPEEAAASLQAAGVAAGPVLDTMGIVANPQLRSRGFFISPDHPEVGPREVMGTPVQYSAVPEKRTEPAPLFDQHNGYVFKELLGLREDEIDQLLERQVIY